MTSQLMIGQLNNWFSSVNTYADMSPDLSIRRQVNERMKARTRRALSRSEWCQLFSTPASTRPVLSFIYQYFGQYSGIEFGRVRPSDRLNCDLHFPLVCWFDWSLTFCEDFFQQFNLDLSDRFDEAAFETIGELVNFLVEQMSVEQMPVKQMASQR
ncbi:MAG: hypothetical protein ACR2FS_09445 [Phormidesmis sp.]